MKTITCLILMIFSALALSAQIKNIDSLKLALQKEKTDTGRVQKLIYLGTLTGEKKTILLYYILGMHFVCQKRLDLLEVKYGPAVILQSS